MTIYFCSDTHFLHDNIIKYCNRPFANVEQMNTEIVQRFNRVVPKDGFTFFVGDVSAGLKGRVAELTSIVGQLNGEKVLIKGNHDHLEDAEYVAIGFKRVFPWFHAAGLFIVHYPMIVSAGAKKKIQMQDDCIAEYQKVKNGVNLIIHGHVHQTSTPEVEGHFNVASDRHNFYPVSLEDIMHRTGMKFEETLDNLVSIVKKD